VSDLTVPGTVTVLSPLDEVIVAVVPPQVLVTAEEEAAEAAEAAEAEAAEGEGETAEKTEPEE
jgi:hypothetical protein